MFVEGAVAEHGVEDVDAAAGEADEGGVVVFALGAFVVVVGAGCGGVQGGERGQEERPSEDLVPASGRVLCADRGPERRVTGAIPA